MKTVTLAIGLFLCFNVMLPGADETGYLKARGKPTGPGLFVDGKYIGPAGRFTVAEKYQIPAGDHEVVLRDPRYEDYATKITIRPRKTTKISYHMKKVEPAKPPFGRLRFGGDGDESFMSLTAGDTGAVYINDKYYGFIDELNNQGGGLLLNPGTYNVHVVSEKFGDFTKQVTVEAHKVVVIPLKQK